MEYDAWAIVRRVAMSYCGSCTECSLRLSENNSESFIINYAVRIQVFTPHTVALRACGCFVGGEAPGRKKGGSPAVSSFDTDSSFAELSHMTQ